MDLDEPAADWRSPEPYRRLCRCGRPAFAWEWLRRSPAYRVAAVETSNGIEARCLGLHRFEPFDSDCFAARPIWRADADPFVIRAVATKAGNEADAFNLARIARWATFCSDRCDGEHWLFADGWRAIRLDVEGTLREGPVRLDYRLAGVASAAPTVRALDRLIGLARAGRLLAKQFPSERRAPRWALVLRVHDALAAGASATEVGATLFDLPPRVWRRDAPSYFSRVQRLVRHARRTARTPAHFWLDGRFP